MVDDNMITQHSTSSSHIDYTRGMNAAGVEALKKRKLKKGNQSTSLSEEIVYLLEFGLPPSDSD